MPTTSVTFFPPCIPFWNLLHPYSWLLCTCWQQFIPVKTVYMPFSHEMTIWPPYPIPDCFTIFVIVLQTSSPLIQVQVPECAASLITSSCHNTILFCPQSALYLYIFPPLPCPFSYFAQAFLFTVQLYFSLYYLNTNCICTLSFMCLYKYVIHFLSPFHFCVIESVI